MLIVEFINIKNYVLAIELIDSKSKATAAVVGKECGNHGNITYEFFVENTKFKHTSNKCEVSCENVKNGDLLAISYIANDPTLSDCGNLEGKANSTLISFFICIIFTLLFILFGYYSYKSEANKNS